MSPCTSFLYPFEAVFEPQGLGYQNEQLPEGYQRSTYRQPMISAVAALASTSPHWSIRGRLAKLIAGSLGDTPPECLLLFREDLRRPLLEKAGRLVKRKREEKSSIPQTSNLTRCRLHPTRRHWSRLALCSFGAHGRPEEGHNMSQVPASPFVFPQILSR